MENAVTVLQEIAGLLRRRVEQTDEQVVRSDQYHKESDERLANINANSDDSPDFSKMREESEKRLAQMMESSEQRRGEAQREKEQAQAEEREFRQNLLAALARHNAALEQILARLETP